MDSASTSQIQLEVSSHFFVVGMSLHSVGTASKQELNNQGVGACRLLDFAKSHWAIHTAERMVNASPMVHMPFSQMQGASHSVWVGRYSHSVGAKDGDK